MSNEPLRLMELPGALSTEQCERLILLFGETVRPSRVYGNDPSGAQTAMRTSSSAKVVHSALPKDVREALLDRVAEACSLPVEHQEPWEIIRYEPGQRYFPHFDYLRAPNASGQRLYSALLYLRAPQAGGETTFDIVGRSIVPEVGKLVVWSNTVKDTDRLLVASLHSAGPVTLGEKWSFAGWIRARPYEP